MKDFVRSLVITHLTFVDRRLIPLETTPAAMEKVVVVGGGLGGLLLAILLEKASLEYVVLERSDVAKMPMEGGGVITITPQIQPVLKQLGLLDALQRMAKPLNCISVLEVDQGSGNQPKVVGKIIDKVFSDTM